MLAFTDSQLLGEQQQAAMRNAIVHLRIVGIAEGISFLVLLLIAMPLKYFAGMPLGVRIVGSLHGALFILYVVVALRAAWLCGWRWTKTLEVLLASLYPFGTFILDRKLRAEEHAIEASK